MTGRRIVLTSEISTDLGDHPYRFTQQHGWLQALFLARLRNLWVDSGTGEWSIEEAAEFAAGGLEGSLLFF